MKASVYFLPWFVAAAAASSWAASPPGISANQQLRLDVRDALEAQRVAGLAAERREEAAVGRRLTAAERARLREQVRAEWAARTEAEALKVGAPVQGASATTATAGETQLADPTGAQGISH